MKFIWKLPTYEFFEQFERTTCKQPKKQENMTTPEKKAADHVHSSESNYQLAG